MTRSVTLIVLSGTFVGLAVLYGPQPLLPLLGRSFHVSEAEAASLITWSLLAMSIGPIVSGWLMQWIAPRRLLGASLVLLGLSEWVFAAGVSLPFLMGIRLIEGLLVSGLLAATMTYISAVSTTLRTTMGYYVAASVAGGLVGRIVAGYLAQTMGWPSFFVALGAVTVLVGLLTLRLPPEPRRAARQSGSLGVLFATLRDPRLVRCYSIVFAGFFAMTGLLNYVPFRLEALDASLSEGRISLFYLGFLLGLVVALNAPRIAETLGGVWPTVMTSIAAMGGGVMVASLPSIAAVFAAVAIATSGFFLMHAVVAASLNEGRQDDAGAVNSMYIAVYYIGGTAGSYLPGLVYVQAGWSLFLALLGLLLAAGLLVTLSLRHRLAGAI